MEIEYKGIIYTIQRNKYESNDTFYERMWAVVKQEPVTEKDFEKAIYNSNLWSNYKHLGCSYSLDISNIVKNLDKIIYTQ